MGDAKSSSFDDNLERLLKVVKFRSSGSIDDEEVERAVSDLLLSSDTNNGGKEKAGKYDKRRLAASENPNNSVIQKNNSMNENLDRIESDDENYDDDDDNNGKDDHGAVIRDTTGTDATIVFDNEDCDNKNKMKRSLPKWTGEKASIESLREQERAEQQKEQNGTITSTNNSSNHHNNQNSYQHSSCQWEQLDAIPLGRIGSQMMVTFGDGPNPIPEACATALLGTRKCLQNAIKDARALRRKMQHDFATAKLQLNQSNMQTNQSHGHSHGHGHGHSHHMNQLTSSKTKVETNSKTKRNTRANTNTNTNTNTNKYENNPNNHHAHNNHQNTPSIIPADPEMLFKAIRGWYTLESDTPSGFDEHQLQVLFPEEMNAYRRWETMHKAYTEKSVEDEQKKISMKKNTNTDDPDDDHDESKDTQNQLQEQVKSKKSNEYDEIGGHLYNRLAQFDLRTDQMKEAWYMAFAEVRKGSFLPRTSDQESKQWEQIRKQSKLKGKGTLLNSRKGGNWESHSASSVQFLHWIGFDHRSALPPPNEKTTQALAFLAYDFLGKIVEKAIFLKCIREKERMICRFNSDGKLVLQLDSNEQLTKEDINEALRDSSVASTSLYNSLDSSLPTTMAAQLYFGPGFENRLEMEMEEIFLHKKKHNMLTKEEIETRKNEDELFAKLDAPPVVLEGVLDIMGNQFKSDGVSSKRKIDKKAQRKKDVKRLKILQNLKK